MVDKQKKSRKAQKQEVEEIIPVIDNTEEQASMELDMQVAEFLNNTITNVILLSAERKFREAMVWQFLYAFFFSLVSNTVLINMLS